MRIPIVNCHGLTPLLLACSDPTDAPVPDTADTAEVDDTAETGETGTTVADLDPYVQPDVWVSPIPLVAGGEGTIHYAGPLAGAAALVAHYGFNGWNEVSGLEDAETESEEGDVSWYVEREMEAVSGGFELTVDVPADARAMHLVFRAPDDGVWDNNEGHDYSASVRFPYAGPYLTWNDDAPAGSGAVVNWETSIPCKGVVEYGPDEDLGSFAVGEVTSNRHHVPVSGFSLGERVWYRVHDSAGQASEIESFTTIGDGPVEFAVFGDAQDYGEVQRWSEVAAAIDGTDPDFLVATGDLTAADKPGAWWTFFDKGRALLAGRAIVPTIGNHDTPGPQCSEETDTFADLFPMPSDSGIDGVYVLDVADLRFLVLESCAPDELAEGGAQYEFARAALDGAEAAWTFASLHVPPYNAGEKHAAEQDAVRPVTALFDGAVDWAFSGHEHLAQRTVPVRFDATAAPSGAYGRGEADGVGYVVVPPAGNFPGDGVADRPEEVALLAWPETDGSTADSELGFVRVEVAGEELAITTYGMGIPDAPTAAAERDRAGYSR